MASTDNKNNQYKLILASGSPRRKELLGWMNIPFEIIVSNIDEITDKVHPKEVAEDLATIKGQDVYQKLMQKNEHQFPFIISSDTIVTLGEKIYGKPKNVQEAREMLIELEGKKHEVVTAVAFIYRDQKSGDKKERAFSISTKVTFEKIDRDLLENYLASGDSLDKAGSYGIQGQGLTFISSIEGSYSNVVGFPLTDFIYEFKKELGHENDTEGQWRELFC